MKVFFPYVDFYISIVKPQTFFGVSERHKCLSDISEEWRKAAPSEFSFVTG
jgi:hypothetical protein